MTFEESVEKYLEEHGDFGTAMNFGRAMYEAGKAASRRPAATVISLPHWFAVYSDGVLIRGGFETRIDAKEWSRSNGYDVC